MDAALAIAAATGIALPLLTGATVLARVAILDNNNKQIVEKPQGQVKIEHGLVTAARLVTRFYENEGISVVVESARTAYKTARITCIVPPDVEPKKLEGVSRKLEHYLSAWGVDINSGSMVITCSGKMHISFTKTATKPILLSRIMRENKPNESGMVLGISMNGDVVRLPLNRKAYPHVLIAGTTGSGKTFAAIVMAINAISMGWKVVIVNPKKVPENPMIGLWTFKDSGNVIYTDDLNEISREIEKISTSMEKADRPVLVVVDEAAYLLNMLKSQVGDPLGTIAQKGREYGVHLAMLVPKATKEVLISDMLHANVATAFIGMKMNSRSLSHWATGLGDLRLDALAGEGHAKLKLGSDIIEFQVALPDNVHDFITSRQGRTDTNKIHPHTLEWYETIPQGGKMSINGLRAYLSQTGRGQGYEFVSDQFAMLVDNGLVERTSSNKPGVKV